MKVAINGFGRIGRSILRASLKERNVNFVAINDLGDVKIMARLLQNDSVFGRLNQKVSVRGRTITIGKRKIRVLCEKDPGKLPWKRLGVDIVIESTGRFLTKELASKHLKAGAKRVILSAPFKGDKYIKTIVMGVNSNTFDKEKDKIISMASCTTNCLAPVVKVLHDNFGIVNGFMTTIHAYTGDQRLVDAPHKDYRRARAAAINIIPTTTGAARAVTEAIPDLKGKLDGMAIRVPVVDGSITDFVAVLKKSTSINEINNCFKKASRGKFKGIIEYSEENLVSTDIVGNPAPSIFDSLSTMVDGDLVKVLAWYDNEWGYSSRMVELIKFISK